MAYGTLYCCTLNQQEKQRRHRRWELRISRIDAFVLCGSKVSDREELQLVSRAGRRQGGASLPLPRDWEACALIEGD